MTSDEMEELLNPENVLCIKLVTGDTVLAKSYSTTQSMHEEGGMEVHNCMKLKTMIQHGPNGELQELLMLSPWIEAAAILSEHFIPADTIITAVPVLPHYGVMYANRLLVQVLKETAQRNAMERGTETDDSVPDRASMHQPIEPYPTIDPTLPAPVPPTYIGQPPEPRTTEFLDKDRMYEAEMTGDIEMPEEETTEEPKAWKPNGITIH